MRRIEPAFPDLLPVTHRLGWVSGDGTNVVVDPVEMRLVPPGAGPPFRPGERTLSHRPIRVLVHASAARDERSFLKELVAGGSGLLVVLDAPLAPEELPDALLPGQVVVLAPQLAEFWGGGLLPELACWSKRGAVAGVLLVLGPVPDPLVWVSRRMAEAAASGAGFVLAIPLRLPPEERRRIYELRAGESGNIELENLLFHTDLGQLAWLMEREASRVALSVGLSETLPGPATAIVKSETFAAGTTLLLWARRLDLMDGVGSLGWQLRRAARALLASTHDIRTLLREDNLRLVPGFTPWVEMFTRSVLDGSGQPFDETLARWLSV